MSEIQALLQDLESEKRRAITGIQTEVLRSISDFMYAKEVPQLMPILLSTFTDPLCHSVFDASIRYRGQELKLTKSMTIHKQIAVLSSPRFFILSPNIRLETDEMMGSGRHLIEFSQLEMEFRDWDKSQFMGFVEDLLVHVTGHVAEHRKGELELLGRKLRVPKKPFMRYESKELEGDTERAVDELSEDATEPFWVLDHRREFYDREDMGRRGYFHNYDLVYPEGFSEALSGGEREFDYREIVRKMMERGQDPTDYGYYIEFAKAGRLGRSAGGGLGIERLLRYCTGVKDIDEVCLFSRKPGKEVLL